MTLPLSGIRVVDLTRVLAGPLVGQMLGDFGADVIKIERPDGGDESRFIGPPFLAAKDGSRTHESGFYPSANRNKRSVTVDLSTTEGQDIVRKLAAQSDIFIENFRVGALAKYGLDYASLSKLNPKLVYLSITGYGQTGKKAPQPGYDAIFQASAGHMAVTGAPDHLEGGGPMRSGLSIVDILTSLYASIAIMGALNYRNQHADRHGQYIDVSLLDSMVATLTHRGEEYLISGKAAQRKGNVGAGGSPSGMFRCADGNIVITVGNDGQWRRFCKAVGLEEMLTDPRFAGGTKRIENRALVMAIVQEAFEKRTKAELLALLEAAEIPSGPVNELPEVFADEQVLERGMVVTAEHPLAGMMRMIGNPIHYSETPLKRYQAPPLLGQHTEEVLRSVLGMTEEQIVALREAKAI